VRVDGILRVLVVMVLTTLVGASVPTSRAYCALEPGWYTSFDEALAAAKARNVPLLLRFSGAAWSELCRRLDGEVFATDHFKQWAKDNVVVCVVEKRNGRSGDPADAATEALAAKYGVWAYPTVVLIDGDGQAIGQMFYEPVGAEDYVVQLRTLLEGCRAWNEGYTELVKSKNDARGLRLAARLFETADYGDQRRLLNVARYIFHYDKNDETGKLADAASMVGETDDPRARDALSHLASLETTDAGGRYGFVLLARSDKDFRRLMADARRVPAGAQVSPAVRDQAQRLYRRLREAKSHIKQRSLMARLYARIGVTLGCVGKFDKAERALERAARLGAPAPVVQGYRDFVAALQ